MGRLEQAVGGDLRIVFASPPQHGKTETTLAGLCWTFLKHPGRRHAYITYNQGRANKISRKVRRMMLSLGHPCRGTLRELHLPGGGQCLFTSIDGGITGEPVDGLAVIDDPYKNRKEADSQQRRQVVEDAYREAIETRVHPGATIIVMATRWHPTDLSGVLSAEEGWESINLPAVAEANDPLGRKVGEALFPEFWPVEALAKKRTKVLEFAWDALYQGRPRPRGGSIFKGQTFYTRLPDRFRGGYGIDLAYTAKTGADHSVCVELLREDRGRTEEPLYYVVRVDSEQLDAPEFGLILRSRHLRRPKWRFRWRASGTEKGSAQFLRGGKFRLPIDVTQPPGDKRVSATETAVAWNEGRILVPDPEVFPECEEWLWPFLDVVRDFTGNGKERDDEVDALGNAHDQLAALPGSVYQKGRRGPRARS